MNHEDGLSEPIDKPKDLIILPDSELKRLNTMIGILFIVAGLLLTLLHFAFFIICLLSILPFTKRQGVEISPTGMQFRKFVGYLGWRKGVWKNIPPTSAVVILSMTGSKVIQYFNRGYDHKIEGMYYELFIMDANHHRRILVQVSDNASEITRLAKKISSELELPIEEFNPAPIR